MDQQSQIYLLLSMMTSSQHQNLFLAQTQLQSSPSTASENASDNQKIAISEDHFNNLLDKWIQYQQERKNKGSGMLEISGKNERLTKRRKSATKDDQQDFNIIADNCQICQQDIINSTKANFCRICARCFCIQCMGRMRVLKEKNMEYWQKKLQSETAPTCTSCDTIHLKSLIEIQFEKELEPKAKQLKALRQSLQKNQQNDIKSNSSEPTISKKLSVKQMQQKISSLERQNRSLQKQNLETKRKISWGEDVKQNLKQKLISTRRRFQKSLSSQSLSLTQGMKAPCAYESETALSALNESLAASVIQEESRMVDRTKCCAAACSIM